MMPEIETVFLATAIKWSYLSSPCAGGRPLRAGCFPLCARNVERALIAKREAGEL